MLKPIPRMNIMGKILGGTTARTGGVVGNILGHNKFGGATMSRQHQWGSFSTTQKNSLRKKYPDSDGDGVPNRWDCQPHNKRFQEEEDEDEEYDQEESKKYFEELEKKREKEEKEKRENYLYFKGWKKMRGE